ncbi:MAG TPA: glycoside hydrolase family 3 N-terminal domain-containing protein, partial [Caldilineaceae bacterium]|nr:glycoside hydrolase family 3 N-terminal domain-containing protein [Caldilineaceae bacterium]
MTYPLRILQALILALFLAASVLPAPLAAQTATPAPASPLSTPQNPAASPEVAGAANETLDAAVNALLAQMSVADRVGQLFLITFQGSETGFDSDIAQLIYGYRVGGVVLSARNGNFSNEAGIDTPRQVATLANQLQALAYGLLLPTGQALPPDDLSEWPPEGAVLMEPVIRSPPPNLPLFIAVEQLGDSLPATALRRGFTPLPSQMALGATWDPELTNQVGQIVGRELAAVGVNLLLGPSLDVLEQPRPEQVGVLGIHSFGGDPYWVSQLGRAYIAGVHSGSGGQVATVARHFPGAGDADRLPDQEVATVQRSIEELRRIALPPFLAVTREPSSLLHPNGDPAATDAIMSSHIRYSAFQGSSLGRNTPISLAPELETVLEQEGFADWRRQGGLLVSNALGAPAIRRHYDPSLTEFPSRRVAMDAFTAGHDLLYLGRFSLDDRWESEKRNIQETIVFFQERYLRDPDFAAQVDAAVRRILRLKLRLYHVAPEAATPSSPTPEAAPALTPESAPTITPAITASAGSGPADAPLVPLTQVLVRAPELEVLAGENRAAALVTVGQVARDSFTLLYPDPASAADVVSVAPQRGDSILIFTDSRLIRECEQCIAEAAVGPDDLAEIIKRLYGAEGTGQLAPEQIVSLTFSDLAQLLEAEQTP